MWGVVCAVVAALAAQGAEASWSPDALLNHASGMREKVFQTQVVGGQATGPGRLTFMASLSLPPATSKYHHFCGGALISPRHVLTAAHCIDGTPFVVRLGSYDISNMEDTSEIIKVRQTHVHPGFDATTTANDLAIVELQEASKMSPAFLSGFVQVDEDPSSGPPAGPTAIVAGWGATGAFKTDYPDELHAARVALLPLEDCFRLYGHTLVDDTKLCVSVDDGVDSCGGDSGGPLVRHHPSLRGRYVQVGLVSWGSDPCGHTHAVYLKPSAYRDFILGIVPSLAAGDGSSPPPSTWPAPWLPPSLPPSVPPSPRPYQPVPSSGSPDPPYPPRPTPRPRDVLVVGATAAADGPCSCEDDTEKWGAHCANHDDDAFGAWCWVEDACETAVAAWWGPKFMYCEAEEAATADSTMNEVLLQEDWSGGISVGWQVQDEGDYMAPSEWMVDSNRVLRQRSNILHLEARADLPKRGTLLVYSEGRTWTDYDFSLHLASTDNDVLGIVFRYQDENNFYRFSMDQQPRAFLRRLVKCVDGAFSLLASDHVAYTSNVYYTITATVEGDSITVMSNGETIFDVIDTSLRSGTIGLYSWGNKEAFFDDLLVLSPDAVALRKLMRPVFGLAQPPQRMAEARVHASAEATAEEAALLRGGAQPASALVGSFSGWTFVLGVLLGMLLGPLLILGARRCRRRQQHRRQQTSQQRAHAQATDISKEIDLMDLCPAEPSLLAMGTTGEATSILRGA